MAMIDSASLMTLGLGGDRRGNMIRQKSVPSFRSNQDFTCGRADYTVREGPATLRTTSAPSIMFELFILVASRPR